jgi:hypothetical protein
MIGVDGVQYQPPGRCLRPPDLSHFTAVCIRPKGSVFGAAVDRGRCSSFAARTSARSRDSIDRRSRSSCRDAQRNFFAGFVQEMEVAVARCVQAEGEAKLAFAVIKDEVLRSIGKN